MLDREEIIQVISYALKSGRFPDIISPQITSAYKEASQTYDNIFEPIFDQVREATLSRE